MEFDIGLELPPYDSAFVEKLVGLSRLVFGDTKPDYVTWRLNNMPEGSAAEVFTLPLDAPPVCALAPPSRYVMHC